MQFARFYLSTHALYIFPVLSCVTVDITLCFGGIGRGVGGGEEVTSVFNTLGISYFSVSSTLGRHGYTLNTCNTWGREKQQTNWYKRYLNSKRKEGTKCIIYLLKVICSHAFNNSTHSLWEFISLFTGLEFYADT